MCERKREWGGRGTVWGVREWRGSGVCERERESGIEEGGKVGCKC